VSFQEKSAVAITAALAVVYGVYFAIVARWLATTPAPDIVYQPLMIAALVLFGALVAVSHIGIAVAKPRDVNANDERDRLITLRGERAGGYVLALGVFIGIVLAMAELSAFFIAHTLLLAWVLAEMTEGATKVVLYRRGA
jgi:hypothetical protein